MGWVGACFFGVALQWPFLDILGQLSLWSQFHGNFSPGGFPGPQTLGSHSPSARVPQGQLLSQTRREQVGFLAVSHSSEWTFLISLLLRLHPCEFWLCVGVNSPPWSTRSIISYLRASEAPGAEMNLPTSPGRVDCVIGAGAPA